MVSLAGFIPHISANEPNLTYSTGFLPLISSVVPIFAISTGFLPFISRVEPNSVHSKVLLPLFSTIEPNSTYSEVLGSRAYEINSTYLLFTHDMPSGAGYQHFVFWLGPQIRSTQPACGTNSFALHLLVQG